MEISTSSPSKAGKEAYRSLLQELQVFVPGLFVPREDFRGGRVGGGELLAETIESFLDAGCEELGARFVDRAFSVDKDVGRAGVGVPNWGSGIHLSFEGSGGDPSALLGGDLEILHGEVRGGRDWKAGDHLSVVEQLHPAQGAPRTSSERDLHLAAGETVVDLSGGFAIHAEGD